MYLLLQANLFCHLQICLWYWERTVRAEQNPFLFPLLYIWEPIISIILKAMDQLDHVTSVMTITVCKAVDKLITEIDFGCQTDRLASFVHVYMVPQNHSSY